MKCKHELCYTGSSTVQKQVLRPSRTPQKPGTVSTKAVVSENISLCVPCQGTVMLLGMEGAGVVSPQGISFHGPHLAPANAPLAPPTSQGQVPDAS